MVVFFKINTIFYIIDAVNSAFNKIFLTNHHFNSDLRLVCVF
jgi:hypothetical protein